MKSSTRSPSGRSRLALLALLAGLFLAAVPAGATPPRLARRSAAEGSDPSAYWTRERMLAARPAPMPEPAADVVPAENGIAGPVVSEPGSAPTLHLPPEAVPAALEEEDDADGDAAAAAPESAVADSAGVSVPAFAGTSGCHFSSSRLNPRTIDVKYPYGAVGKLFFTKPGVGDFVCSGAVLRRRIVLTAGHCVHAGNGLQSGYFTNFLFCPAYRGGPSAKYGCWGWTGVGTTSPWWVSNNVFPNASDFGMIEIQDRVIGGVTRRIGDLTGYFGYATSSLTANHVHLLGYPVDFSSGARMHEVASGQTVGPSGPNLIVGVTSYANVSTDPKYQGSSIPDANFTNLLTVICNRDVTPPANCF